MRNQDNEGQYPVLRDFIIPYIINVCFATDELNDRDAIELINTSIKEIK